MRMPQVEQHMTLVYIEPIGTGASGRLSDPRGYNLDTYARFVDGLIEHLGLEAVYLLGHSHGGFVAQRYALDHPERLTGLILYDSVPTTGPDWQADVMENLGRYADQPWFSDATQALEQENSASSDEEVSGLLQRMLPLYFADYSGREGEFVAMRATIRAFVGPNSGVESTPFDTRGDLASIRIPTLVIVGRYDFICSEKFARILHEGIAESQLVVLEQSGHFGHLEEPQTFARAVANFFSE
jgi:proline iminopeptidase